MEVDYTFHSHTYRCNHATGDIEDYVSLAIQKGLKLYGVSDHVFLPGVSEPRTRGEYSCLEEYIETYNKVKEKYGKEIEMYLGFECEYADVFKDYYKSLLKDRHFDYLILGQHNGFDENKNYIQYVKNHVDDSLEDLEKYTEDVINGIRSGLFFYVAHPDLLFVGAKEVTPLMKKVTKELIKVGEKYDIPFEINIHGFLRQERRKGLGLIGYPADYFWEEVSKSKIKVVYGGDYHDLDEVGSEHFDEVLTEFIRKYNLKLVDIKEEYKKYRQRIVNIK